MIQVKIPEIGTSAFVARVLVAVGDTIKEGTAVLELESDKASMEVPSDASGVVSSILVRAGDQVSDHQVILELESAEAPAESAPKEAAPEAPKATTPAATPPQKPEKSSPVAAPVALASRSGGAIYAGPAARKFAREHEIDLSRIPISDPSARLSLQDVKAFEASGGVAPSRGRTGKPLPDFSKFGKVTSTPMSKIQKLTAEHMEEAQGIPAVTQFDEANITSLEHFRKSLSAEAEKQDVKLTLLPFIILACAKALRARPEVNVSVDMLRFELVQKQYVNIGFAVDSPFGLFVPVITHADEKNLWTLAKEIYPLARLAREGKLTPAQLQGGCFSISSLGSIGGTHFTPLINAPEVAILGVGKASLKPVYDEEMKLVPSLILPLSLTYDHRAINGADAARFLVTLKSYLEDLRRLALV